MRWNPNVAGETGHGRLSISDGAIRKDLELETSELRNGSIVYSPATDDVVLRLEIIRPDLPSPMSGSVRIVAGGAPPPPHALPSDLGGVGRVARSNAAWTPDVREGEGAAAQDSAIVRSLLRTPYAEPFSGVRASSLAPQGSKIEPATLILRKNPVYPALAEQSLGCESVEVHFRISPEGKVYNARSVKGSPILAQAAIEAVKVWSFDPARLNGAPVDSQGSTTFDFTPN